MQSRFVDEYLIDLNGSRAVRAAGYSSRGDSVQATRLLRNVSIQAQIEKRCLETEIRLQISRDQVVQGLLSAFEQAKEIGEPLAMIRVMAEVGKMMGIYAPKVAVKRRLSSDEKELKQRIQEMSDKELLEIAQRTD